MSVVAKNNFWWKLFSAKSLLREKSKLYMFEEYELHFSTSNFHEFIIPFIVSSQTINFLDWTLYEPRIVGELLNFHAHIHWNNLGPIQAHIAKMCATSRADKKVSKVYSEQKVMPWENLPCQASWSGVWHKFLGSHVNNRIPDDRWYDTKGPIDMSNIPPSRLPHWKKGINKRGGIRRGG